MTQHEMNTLQSLVKAKATEATKALHNREGIIVERTADEFDEIAIAYELGIAVQHLDRESGLLRDILGALSRIESGTFGTCCTVTRKSVGLGVFADNLHPIGTVLAERKN